MREHASLLQADGSIRDCSRPSTAAVVRLGLRHIMPCQHVQLQARKLVAR